jgi:thiamine-monophosphate kinase
MMKGVALGGGVEFDLIRRFLTDATMQAGSGVKVGPGDDCAIVDAGRVALSLDMSIEGIHFRREWLAPEEIGYHATAAALSDLAAVAAEPIGLLVGLAVAEAEAEELGPRIMHGVTAAAQDARAVLLGGDLSRSPGPIMLDISVFGSVAEPVLRSGARPGDSLWVTGRLGGAAAAVAAWRDGAVPSPEARAAFVRPAPRLREARWLAERVQLHALIDLSDGLAGDAGHMAAASGVGLVIETDAVPIHEAAGALVSGPALDLALHGGEDYELLFAAPPGSVEALVEDFARRFRVPLTHIGAVTEGQDVLLRWRDGHEQELTGGFDHFQRATP